MALIASVIPLIGIGIITAAPANANYRNANCSGSSSTYFDSRDFKTGDEVATQTHELSADLCAHRVSKTELDVTYSWALKPDAHLRDGVIAVWLTHCVSGNAYGNAKPAMNYGNGTSQQSGSGTVKFSVVAGSKYQMHFYGQGDIGADNQPLNQKFSPLPPPTITPFKGSNTTCL
jgi:hypothetical protein